MIDDWIFARFHAGELSPGRRQSVTLEHAGAALAGGQRALEAVLEAHPRYRRA